ncbi:response regulator [Mesobacillus subterraneus]|uniref:Response regulator n=1 Tax=Mesobacillus subterraneus TaxID=285983 RepID=A0A427TY02_9BACI|nr:response regulator [Mesobacillus subterraneus]RSD29341.1 response regulator [Mesobacillus subterraneus]
MIKVFIVEDDPMVLDVNIGFLKRLPFFQFCGSATLGVEAVKKIQELKPDLVLLDMFLPDLSGLDVMKSIREQEIPTDVIMITAARDAQTIQDVLRLGAVDYLVKPFRFNRFKSALDAYEKMWNKLNAKPSLKQEDIDEFKQMQGQEEYLPKGLSDKTLKQILLVLMEQTEPVTAESLASSSGMARVTVRRYLEYLVQSNKIRVNIKYGSVGRPSHYYYI